MTKKDQHTADETQQHAGLNGDQNNAQTTAQTTTHQTSQQNTPTAATQSDTEQLQIELEQMTELAKRTMADLQNFRRRQEEERNSITILANLSLIAKILPVLDNLNRAKEHVPESAKEWFQGAEMSINQLSQVLKDFGVMEIDCLNQPFNPDFHEALATGEGQKDTVIEVLEKGYILGDRVVRHAKVKVGNGS